MKNYCVKIKYVAEQIRGVSYKPEDISDIGTGFFPRFTIVRGYDLKLCMQIGTFTIFRAGDDQNPAIAKIDG